MPHGTEFVGYIAMSADGFIADQDGGVGWLDPFASEDQGYEQFIAGIDGLLMGRNTYEFIMGHDWPYGTLPTYLATHKPAESAPNVTASGSLEELRVEIEKAGLERVWIVGGGQVQRAALDAGMFDRMRLFVIPIILGGGVPLFASGTPRRLSVISSTARSGGVVEIEYQIEQ